MTTDDRRASLLAATRRRGKPQAETRRDPTPEETVAAAFWARFHRGLEEAAEGTPALEQTPAVTRKKLRG